MNKPEQQRRICQQQTSSQPVAAHKAATIDHPSAAADRMKNFDTHPGITIKWSLDSVHRRSADAPFGTRSVGVAGGVAHV